MDPPPGHYPSKETWNLDLRNINLGDTRSALHEIRVDYLTQKKQQSLKMKNQGGTKAIVNKREGKQDPGDISISP